MGAERIAADPRVVGVVDTSCSAAAVAASPVIGRAGLVMVSPSNTSPVLTSNLNGTRGSDHHAGYFRVSNNDLYGAVAVADFAYGELGLRRMASVHDGDPYTKGGRLHLDRAALRGAMGAMTGFQGITGVLACDAFGDCGTGRINIYDHRDSSVTDAAQLAVVYRFAP